LIKWKRKEKKRKEKKRKRNEGGGGGIRHPKNVPDGSMDSNQIRLYPSNKV